jgi:hypothetical protein
MTPRAQADEFSLRPQHRQDEGSADDGEAQAGGDSAEELAKKLQNPVAELISIPIQSSFNFNQGPDGDGYQFQFQVKPVVPFKLNDEWNLISRGIFTLTYRDGDVLPGQGSEWGLGDTLLQAFFSPRSTGGLIWGVGPAISLPTATDDEFGSEKWSAGPTAVILAQEGPWTVGALAGHLWSFAGASDRAYVSLTSCQPFVAYTWPSSFTITLDSESTYNWNEDEVAIPVNLTASKVYDFGGQKVALGVSGRYWLEHPVMDNGWGVRLDAKFIIPK